MTLREIVDNTLDEQFVINEGFVTCPAIFYYAFSKPIGSLKVTAEKIKAKAGLKSGKGENATIYKLTPEQKDFLKEIRHKYGSSIENLIKTFRTSVAAPYQIAKRASEDYGKSTSLTRYGMTKDEYMRAYESGRNKILRMNKKDEAFMSSKSDLDSKRAALDELRKKINDFNSGTNIVINTAMIEKLLAPRGLDRESFEWPVADLESAYLKIKKYKELLNNPKTDEEGNEVFYDYRGGRKVPRTRKYITEYIEDIRKYGYTGGKLQDRSKEKENVSKKPGKWEEAFNRYMLRKDIIKDFEKNFSRNEYIAVYKKILQDELKRAEQNFGESKTTFMNVLPRHTLNDREKKIWKLKPTGVINSGDINDWYLAIKPEDFGTKTVKKPRQIERAEYEIKAATKNFENALSKILDEEEMAKLKELRLIDNFISVKISKEDNFIKDVVSRTEKKEGEEKEDKKTGEENDTKRNADE